MHRLRRTLLISLAAGFFLATVIPWVMSALSPSEHAAVEGPVFARQKRSIESQQSQPMPRIGWPSIDDSAPFEAPQEEQYWGQETEFFTPRPSLWEELGEADPRTRVTGCTNAMDWIVLNAEQKSPFCSVQVGCVTPVFTSRQALEDSGDPTAARMYEPIPLLNPHRVERRTPIAEQPSWSIFGRCPEPSWRWLVAAEFRWGWPARSHVSQLWFDASSQFYHTLTPEISLPEFGRERELPLRALLLSTKSSNGSLADSRHLALGVIPLGLTLNGLLFAAAVFLGMIATDRAKHIVRIRRGCCPCCTYSMQGWESSCCPECGWQGSHERSPRD